MCLGELVRLKSLNRVLYPSANWLDLYVANEVLEYKNMKLYLMDQDRRELGKEWQKAAEMLWSAGRRGEHMSEMLALEALEIWTGNRAYRRASANIGVDPYDIIPMMVELLGGEVTNLSEGLRVHKGWYEIKFQPTFDFLAQFHIKLEHIHPLHDGNGRWGRLLLIHGYGRMNTRPATITDRDTYLRAVSTSDVSLLASLL